jgi:nicotinamide mononucleotide adenylyltransferase
VRGMMAKTILFSGRFDPPNLGHIMTLQRLAQEYAKVIVCILDYPQQFQPIKERLEIMESTLYCCIGNYEIMVNNVHFGVINKEDIEPLPDFDVYGSGNAVCEAHMTKLGYKVVDVRRTPGYASTDIRDWLKLKKYIRDSGIRF